MRVIDLPEKLAPLVARTRARGVEVGLRLGIVCRPTRDEAVAAAESLRAGDEAMRNVRTFLKQSDSQTQKEVLALADDVGWMNSYLWAGLVPSYGPSAITMVGTPAELAAAFMEYQRIGVTQFIISGWPKLEEMITFGREVIPRVREAEASAA